MHVLRPGAAENLNAQTVRIQEFLPVNQVTLGQ